MKTEVKIGETVIDLEIVQAGEDLCITLSGGDKPHIGCVVLAQPHPGISNPQKTSATVSVLNCVGHRDAEIAQPLAKRLAAGLNCVVVVTCGIHFEHYTPEIQKDILGSVELIEQKVCGSYKIFRLQSDEPAKSAESPVE